MTKLISKFVRVATEGPTIDGREITGAQIEQMAANYSPQKYGARVWLEHFRSLFPQSIFSPLGDVPELSVDTNEKGKKVLLAKIEPLPALVKMNKNGEKVFTSIEMDTNFAGTGEAYMVGLAVTDTPASTGTEMLKFSATNKEKFADAGDLTKNTYSAYLESSTFEFSEDAPQNNESEKPSLMSRVSALLSKDKGQNEERFSDIDEAVTVVAQTQDDLQKSFSDNKSLVTKLSDQVTELGDKIDTITKALEKTSGQHYTPRPKNTGTESEQQADC